MYNNRVHLKGGGGEREAARQEALRKSRQEARKGNFESTDDMYRYLSEFADPNYREESYRDIDFQGYHKNLGKDSLAYKDAEAYKSAILRAGDPRGMFTGNISDPRYGTPEEVAKSQKYLSHFNRHTSALGFDPAGIAAGVEPQPILSTFPGANPQPTAAPSEPAPPVLPPMTAADRGYKPFMTMEEGQEYYGQFMANGGVVPNTLRRKMFSMGGNVPGHHGVGITSGMRYNKGGSVQATYGVGNNANKKMGPDGQQREAHGFFIPAVKGLANLALMGIPKLLSKNARNYGYRGLEKIRKYAKSTGMSMDEAIKATGGIKELAKDAGVARAGAFSKALTRGAPAVYGAGLGSAVLEREGIIDPERSKIEAAISDYAGLPVDYLSLPGYASMGYQAALDEPGTESDIQTLTDLIAGRDKKASSDQDFGSQDNVQGIVDRISAEDQLRQDFEARKNLYLELMGSKEDENNLGVLGRSLLEASETLNQGKGMISAGNVFGMGIADEVDRRAERDTTIRDAAATQAITDVSGERSQMNAVIQEMIATGQASQIPILEAVMSAQEAGIPIEEIPMDGNKEDVEALSQRKNSVFMDSAKIMGGGIFVAVNSQGEIATFNNVQNAIAFAEDRS